MLHPLLEESELHDWEVAVAAQILYPPKFLMTLAHCCFSSFSLLSEFLLHVSWARYDRSEYYCLQVENEGRKHGNTSS